MGNVVKQCSAEKEDRHALLREQAFVGGYWIDASTGQAVAVTNPATGEELGHVPALSAEEVGEAIRSARGALGAWSALLPRERADCLGRWHDLIVANTDELAELMVAEQGKSFADARGEVDYGASFIRWFAEEASRVYGEVIPSHLPDRKMLVQNEPLGVVALVTPWNFPLAMIARKAAAALAAGCTAVVAPSMETPFSALALAALAEQAGVPAGVYSVVTGDPETVVGTLCDSPEVRGLSFTGSTAVGQLLLARCAPTVKRVSLELGGHAPFIIFPDSDVKEAARAAVAAKFQTSGQDCLAANRIYVHAEVADAFNDLFAKYVRELVTGHGMEPGVDLGPLINERGLSKTEEHVADAVAKGARIVTGGRRHALGGTFYEPTLLSDVTPEMAIVREETFGPVAAVMSFSEESEVIQAANDTEYGLVAYVYTRDLSRAWRVTDALEYGMVAVNTIKLTGAPVPFGGIKQSGLGREGSRHGITEFLNRKYICIGL